MTAVPTYLRNGRSGDVIVFLHGIGGNAEYWQPQLSFFGKHFQAVAGTCRVTVTHRLSPK